MADSTPPAGGSQAPTPPLPEWKRSLIWWGRLANYLLLGVAVLLIAMEIAESGSGVWRRLGIPLMFVSMAILNLAVMHMQERKRTEQNRRGS